jgi:hypothetical protein
LGLWLERQRSLSDQDHGHFLVNKKFQSEVTMHYAIELNVSRTEDEPSHLKSVLLHENGNMPFFGIAELSCN